MNAWLRKLGCDQSPRIYLLFSVVCALIVCLCAVLHYAYIMRIEARAVDYVTPFFVGAAFGVLLAHVKLMHDVLATLARSDALTGLHNRRAFEEFLEREIDVATRTGRPFTVTIFDIDHFKTINDTFGHNGGDLILKKFADMCRGMRRMADLYARWGGEEFVALFADTTLAEATLAAQRLRESIRNHDFGLARQVTASFGVTAFEPGIDTKATLMARADSALYAAKASGRDRVEVATASESGPQRA